MRRNFTQLYVHLVWATWDRLPLITPDLQKPIYNVIAYECKQMGCHVITIGGIEDHVHLLTGFPSSLAIARQASQRQFISQCDPSNKTRYFFQVAG